MKGRMTRDYTFEGETIEGGWYRLRVWNWRGTIILFCEKPTMQECYDEAQQKGFKRAE